MFHQFRPHLTLVLMRYTAAQYTTVPITGQHPLWLSHQRCGEERRGERRRPVPAEITQLSYKPAPLCQPSGAVQWSLARLNIVCFR